jgi:hypothetical protein
MTATRKTVLPSFTYRRKTSRSAKPSRSKPTWATMVWLVWRWLTHPIAARPRPAATFYPWISQHNFQDAPSHTLPSGGSLPTTPEKASEPRPNLSWCRSSLWVRDGCLTVKTSGLIHDSPALQLPYLIVLQSYLSILYSVHCNLPLGWTSPK